MRLPLVLACGTVLLGCGESGDVEASGPTAARPTVVQPAAPVVVPSASEANAPATAVEAPATGSVEPARGTVEAQPAEMPPVQPTGGGEVPPTMEAQAACANMESAQVVNVFDNGVNDGHGPMNVIDGSLESESRWSSEGRGNWVVLDLGQAHAVLEVFTAWLDGDERSTFYGVEASNNAVDWVAIASQRSSQGTEGLEAAGVSAITARYIRIIGQGNSENDWNSLLEAQVRVCPGVGAELQPTVDPPASVLPRPAPLETPAPAPVETPAPPVAPPAVPFVPVPDGPELNPNWPPSRNFDLGSWNVSLPINNGEGKAETIENRFLIAGFQDERFFFTADDGGMVFKCPNDGYLTSKETDFTRVELREMLRRANDRIPTMGINENNWVLSTAPRGDREAAGAVDGVLKARLAINHVTTRGNDNEVGRVVIGQIHANEDEPVRLYYRKLPDNRRGSVYFAHEPRDGYGDERWIEMLGSRDDDAGNPSDGIELDEEFGYEIQAQGNSLEVTLITPSGRRITRRQDMSDSGYDQGGQYLYFKAGAYNQNDSGPDDDFVQVTFYEIETIH